MAKRKTKSRSKAAERGVNAVVSDNSIVVPKRAKKPKSVSLGVEQASFDQPSPMKSSAKYAASNSVLFPKGGEAFERWCADKGIHSRERRTTEEWAALLEEFSCRPIHGLRRGPDGGTHRANRADLRR